MPVNSWLPDPSSALGGRAGGEPAVDTEPVHDGRDVAPGRLPAGPGRATGEPLYLQGGRLTPRTPALRTSHSRACHHHTARRYRRSRPQSAEPSPSAPAQAPRGRFDETPAGYLTLTAKRTRYARQSRLSAASLDGDRSGCSAHDGWLPGVRGHAEGREWSWIADRLGSCPRSWPVGDPRRNAWAPGRCGTGRRASLLVQSVPGRTVGQRIRLPRPR